jgi:hypothetical protein
MSTFFTLSFHSSPVKTPFLRSPDNFAILRSKTSLWDTDPQKNYVDSSEGSSSSRRNSSLQPKHESRKKGIIGASALVATVAAATLAFPSVSNAFDIASISGGANSLAQTANGFLASIADTGFYQAFSLVFVSEIGDKTFFMAGLLAIQTSKFISFVGSMAALAVMTVISVVIGQMFHAVPSGFADGIPLDDIAAVLAFAFFGLKTLKDALDMEGGSSAMDEELADAEETVGGASDAVKRASNM